jgi:hypothetical protein
MGIQFLRELHTHQPDWSSHERLAHRLIGVNGKTSAANGKDLPLLASKNRNFILEMVLF